MIAALAPVVACLTLAGLLWFGERRGSQRDKWLFKPLTSALFLVVAFALGPSDAYDRWIVAGLVLGAVGDVCLIPRSRGAFAAGLVAFLLSHVAYVLAFAERAPLGAVHPATVIAILAMGAALYAWLAPHLGAMRGPVAAYGIAITLMLLGAAAVLEAGSGSAAFRWCVAVGATFFYLSDVTVARDRFVPGTPFANRAVGLPLYYAGQFLLAASIGL